MFFSLNKIKHFIQPLMVAVIGAIFWSACSPSKEYSAELTMESDAMSVVNYYIPKRIELSDTPLEANLVLPELKSNNPRFGSIVMGKSSDASISIVLDEVRDKSNKIISSDLYVDKNNNEDLTDDGDSNWDDDKKTYFMKEVLIDVNYTDDSQIAVPYPVNFYRYKHRLENSVVAFRNGYRKGTITLKDTTYKIAIFDDDLDGLFNERDKGAIVIDSNRDGTLNGESGSGEYFSLRSHFDINGTTYKIKTGYGNLYVTINDDEEGKPFEVFATTGKTGGVLAAKTEAICRLVSLALRSGIPTDKLISQLKGIRGPMPAWSKKGMVLSIPDAISKIMSEHINKGQTNLGEFDSSKLTPVPEQASGAKPKMNIADTGEVPECPDCHNILEFSEGCVICQDLIFRNLWANFG